MRSASYVTRTARTGAGSPGRRPRGRGHGLTPRFWSENSFSRNAAFPAATYISLSVSARAATRGERDRRGRRGDEGEARRAGREESLGVDAARDEAIAGQGGRGAGGADARTRRAMAGVEPERAEDNWHSADGKTASSSARARQISPRAGEQTPPSDIGSLAAWASRRRAGGFSLDPRAPWSGGCCCTRSRSS